MYLCTVRCTTYTPLGFRGGLARRLKLDLFTDHTKHFSTNRTVRKSKGTIIYTFYSTYYVCTIVGSKSKPKILNCWVTVRCYYHHKSTILILSRLLLSCCGFLYYDSDKRTSAFILSDSTCHAHMLAAASATTTTTTNTTTSTSIRSAAAPYLSATRRAILGRWCSTTRTTTTSIFLYLVQ